VTEFKQESCAEAREPHNAAAVVFGLKFADNIQKMALKHSSYHCWLSMVTEATEYEVKKELKWNEEM